MMRLKTKQLLIIISILLGGLALTACNKGNKDDVQASEALPAASVQQKPEVIPVYVQRPKIQTVEEKVSLSGTFFSQKQANISPNVGGKIVFLDVEVGDRVKQGDILFKMDDLQYRLNLERAEAALKEVKSRETQAKVGLHQAMLDLDYKKLDLKRHKNLLKTDTISQSVFDRVKSAYEMSEANVESAKAQIDVIHSSILRTEKEIAIARQSLKDTTVRAPFSGVVTQRRINVDEMTQPGVPAISLEQTDTLELWLNLSSSYLSKIHKGTTLYYEPEGWDSWQKGTIGRIDPTVSESSRTIRVAAIVDNTKGRIVPGLFAKVEIVVDRFPDAIVIPTVAIVNRQQGKTVFVVENDHAEARLIKTGYESDNQTVVLNGLKESDSVITSGHTHLKGGEMISVSRRN